MIAAIHWIESVFRAIPLPVLEVWGRFSYVIGLIVAVFAFAGFTFRPGNGWGLARARQTWDARALWSATLTFVLIPLAGWIGASIVLVEGAQTFESLKDLVVCVCLLLFGYPALLAAPPAYMLSDMIEGVPPDFIHNWFFGYFTSRAFFWLLYQFIGKNPDFRRLHTWLWYLVFVAIEMMLDPQQWGYICSEKFTTEISYRAITPALFFTLAITWALVPLVMLGALPLTRKLSLFWADIPHHASEWKLGHHRLLWSSGDGQTPAQGTAAKGGLPVRIMLAAPFMLLMLAVVGATAYLTLKSAEHSSEKLASRLHHEVADNINLQLDDFLEEHAGGSGDQNIAGIRSLLHDLELARHGHAFILDAAGKLIASSREPAVAVPQSRQARDSADPVVVAVYHALRARIGSQGQLQRELQFRMDVVTAKPLARETWLVQATPYEDKDRHHTDWMLITAIPASYYLEGVFQGNSRAAMMIAFALAIAVSVAGLLSTLVTGPLRRLSRASHALAMGDLSQRASGSRIEELDALAQAFNEMAKRLQGSFDEMIGEVNMRKQREAELRQSDERARSSEERLQLATRAAQMGIWDWDVARNQLMWDDSMRKLYGVGDDGFSGTFEAWSNSLLPEDRVQALADSAAALAGEREYDTEFRIRWQDGSIHHIRAIAQTIRDAEGKAMRMVGVNYDITAAKLAEQELIQHRRHLEELVGERTAALSVAVDRAQASSRAKSAFLANMSHELRTPMNAILGFSGLLQRDDDISDAQREKLAIINKSGEHLLTLINNVLDMSKIESGRVELRIEPFDLAGLVRDVTDMLSAQAQEKGLRLSLELAPGVPHTVRGDEGKLRQIIVNLLGNALRHTHEGGIILRLATRPTGADIRLLIDVEDSGMGIRADDLAHIFEPFVQGGRQASRSGSGLGLAISQEFAHMMNGQISATSSPGLGSTFHVEVDVGQAEAAPLPPPADDPREVVRLAPGQPPWRVLVVEDQADNRLLLETLLSRAGFEVRTAGNGAEAIDVFLQWHPQLIWMDQRMPVLDGLEATRQIRRLPGGEAVRIVAVTASAFIEQRDEILAAGTDDFISKPYHARDIHDCLARLLGVRYEYREASTAASPPAGSLAEPLAALSPARRQSLENALVALDADEIGYAIADIAQTAPALGSLLAYHANKLDYAAILDALQSLQTGAPS
ncbi:ATP-binding protein [Chitinivorax sp. PXF-14]|uniref:ATP-binding protein n=1 Tax=Chitinivorax sp. PXF-14 TaxID=3230488 RepID=UPI0034676C66